MARLVFLVIFIVFAGCTPLQTTMQEYDEVQETLPIERLDEGEHHPAVATLLEQAERARALGRYASAASYIDQAREIEPRNPDIFYRQAWLAHQQNKVVEAEELSRRGLVFAPAGSVVEHRLLLLLQDVRDRENGDNQ